MSISSTIPDFLLRTTSEMLVELLDRVAEHDREAFAALYQATSMKLYGVAVRILKRKHVAEDVVQDAYIKIWEHADEFSALRGSALGWMLAITRNRALDELRRLSHTAMGGDDAALEKIPDTNLIASDVMQRSEEYRKLIVCLGRIGKDKRKMVLLAYHHGLSRENLARRFNQPVPTIKTWLRRSLVAIKACLET